MATFIVCIAGKNQIAVNALDYLLRTYKYPAENIIAVPNSTDDGKDSWQRSFKKFAQAAGIKTVELESAYVIPNLIFISLELNRIVKPLLFASDRLYNIHFSFLPKYKGMYTSAIPILNGEKQSGVTLHMIDEGIDTGDIIAQKKFAFGINDTCRDLYFKYMKYGFSLFKENIHSLITGTYKTMQQHHIGSTYFSKKSLDFNGIKIDLNKTSFEIHNQIRAYIFEEYQLPEINNVRVYKTSLTGQKIGKNYFKDDGDKFIISGIDGFKLEVFKKNTQ